MLVTNDPWMCTGHLYDFTVVTPVFRDGRFVALTGSVGHVTDIGGTTDIPHAREIFEEGLQVPPMKLYRAGVPNEDLIQIIRENVRNPDQVLGDLHALIAANARGADRLLAFMDEYGMEDVRAIAAVVQTRSERAMRDAIRAFPDGVYRSEYWCNPQGIPLRIPLSARVSGDTIELDFTGVAPQLAQGGLNVVLNYTAAYATYPLKCVLTPTVRGNAGDYRPFVLKVPEGTILNCRKPAAVTVRQRIGWYTAPNALHVLAEGAPDRVRAFWGLPFIVNWNVTNPDGTTYSDMVFSGGGQGASSVSDGKSGLIWPTSAANTSLEMFEVRMPVVVLEKTLTPDSGGAGKFRGGLGARLRLRKLDDDGVEMVAAVFPETADVQHPGLFGGRSGGMGSARVVDESGALLETVGAARMVTLTAKSQILELQIAGGSGFGDAAERAPSLIERDLLDGYVTPAGVERDYGVPAATEPKACALAEDALVAVPAGQ